MSRLLKAAEDDKARAEADLANARQKSQGSLDVSRLSSLLDTPEMEQLKADNAGQAERLKEQEKRIH